MGQHPIAMLGSNETQKKEGLARVQAFLFLSVHVGLTISVCQDPNRKQNLPQLVQKSDSNKGTTHNSEGTRRNGVTGT